MNSKALVVQSEAARRALVDLSEIETRIAQSEDVKELKSIADRADALKVYLKKVVGEVDDLTYLQNEAAKVGILARRRGGELIADGQARGEIADRGRPAKSGQAVRFVDLLGSDSEETAQKMAQRWKLLASLSLKQIDEIAKYFNDNGLELTTADCYRAAKGEAPLTDPKERSADDCLIAAEKKAAALVDDLLEAKDKGARVGPKLAAARSLLGLFRNAEKGGA